MSITERDKKILTAARPGRADRGVLVPASSRPSARSRPRSRTQVTQAQTEQQTGRGAGRVAVRRQDRLRRRLHDGDPPGQGGPEQRRHAEPDRAARPRRARHGHRLRQDPTGERQAAPTGGRRADHGRRRAGRRAARARPTQAAQPTRTPRPNAAAAAAQGQRRRTARPPRRRDRRGAPGLESIPLDFTFNGTFFDLADFFHRMKRFVKVANDDIVVRGRLMTIDSLNWKAEPENWPEPDRRGPRDRLPGAEGPGRERRRDAAGPGRDARPRRPPRPAPAPQHARPRDHGSGRHGEVAMHNFLLDLWHDLREKRLWPFAVAAARRDRRGPFVLLEKEQPAPAARADAPTQAPDGGRQAADDRARRGRARKAPSNLSAFKASATRSSRSRTCPRQADDDENKTVDAGGSDAAPSGVRQRRGVRLRRARGGGSGGSGSGGGTGSAAPAATPARARPTSPTAPTSASASPARRRRSSRSRPSRCWATTRSPAAMFMGITDDQQVRGLRRRHRALRGERRARVQAEPRTLRVRLPEGRRRRRTRRRSRRSTARRPTTSSSSRSSGSSLDKEDVENVPTEDDKSRRRPTRTSSRRSTPSRARCSTSSPSGASRRVRHSRAAAWCRR